MSSKEKCGRSKGLNLYVTNLDDSIDDERLLKEFAPFGTITSAKVMTEDGKSKNFGYVCFASCEDAEKAIIEMDGRIVGSKPLYVAPYLTKQERKTYKALKDDCKMLSTEKCDRYQGLNVYVKNLDDSIDDARLLKEFAPFGFITSAKVMIEDGKSKKFGFVCFASYEAAEKAIIEMDGRIVGSKALYVAPYLTKQERKTYKEAQTQARLDNTTDLNDGDGCKLQPTNKCDRYQGLNLYVKNLDESIDDDRLMKEFAPFGTITSAKVMTKEDGTSKKFGFVCFASCEDAEKAINKMHGRLLESKPLYVAPSQIKEERKAYQRAQYLERQLKKAKSTAAIENTVVSALPQPQSLPQNFHSLTEEEICQISLQSLIRQPQNFHGPTTEEARQSSLHQPQNIHGLTAEEIRRTTEMVISSLRSKK